MTKKHFEWAADYVRRLDYEQGDPSARAIQQAFADLFTRFGAKFDEGRFNAACEKEEK